MCRRYNLCRWNFIWTKKYSSNFKFFKDIKSYSHTDALFLNYSNPMAMNTWVAVSEAKVNTVGLCHGVQGGAKLISKALGSENSKDLEYMCSGINHMTLVHRSEIQRKKSIKRRTYRCIGKTSRNF